MEEKTANPLLGISLSAHGLTRMQQRGIRPAALELLVRYGAREHDHKGSQILYFSHRSNVALRGSLVARGFLTWTDTPTFMP